MGLFTIPRDDVKRWNLIENGRFWGIDFLPPMELFPSLLSLCVMASSSLAMANAYDLDVTAPVQLAGSDEAAADFQKNILPDYYKVVTETVNQQEAAKNLSLTALDPSKLTLKSDSTVRVYFVGEGAGYANSLGFSTIGSGPESKDAALIFPNANSTAGWGGTDRYGWAPLQPGDFVNLGTFTAGTKLDFFLIADGANGGRSTFSTSENSDGLIHTSVLAAQDSSYWLVGFEDIFGEAFKNFNDLVFAVQITPSKTRISAPEPSMAIGAALACATFITSRRRKA